MDVALRGNGRDHIGPIINWLLNQARNQLTSAAYANLQRNLWEAAGHGVEALQDIYNDFTGNYFNTNDAIQQSVEFEELPQANNQIERPIQDNTVSSSTMDVDVPQSQAMKRSAAQPAEGEPPAQVARMASDGSKAIGSGAAAPGAMQRIIGPRTQIRSGKLHSFSMRCMIAIRAFSPLACPQTNISSGKGVIFPCIYRFRKTPSMFLSPSDVIKLKHTVDTAQFRTKFTNIRGCFKAINLSSTYITNDTANQSAVNNTATCLQGHVQGLEYMLNLGTAGVQFDTAGVAIKGNEGQHTCDWQSLQLPKIPNLVNSQYKKIEFGSGEESFQQYNLINKLGCVCDKTTGEVVTKSIPDYGSFFPKENMTAASGEIFKFRHKEADCSVQRICNTSDDTSTPDVYYLPHPESSIELISQSQQPPVASTAPTRCGFGYLQPGTYAPLDINLPLVTNKYRHPVQLDRFARLLPEEHVMLIPGFTKNPSETQPITVFGMWECEADLEIDYSASSFSGQDTLMPHMMVQRGIVHEGGFNGFCQSDNRIVPVVQ